MSIPAQSMNIRAPYGAKATTACLQCGKPFVHPARLARKHCSVKCDEVARKGRPNKGTTKHGLCYSLEHRSWRNMIDRCTNPRCKYYPDYGGRGIKVCDRWREFKNFYADMGPKPTDRPRYSIERINNNRGY